MKPPSTTPITHWLEGVRVGDSLAAQQLWNAYFAKLVPIAEAKLRSLNREATGEDIALSALKSVMLGVQADRFPDLQDRHGLWALLVTLTARKSIDQVKRQLAQKRDASATEELDRVREVIGNEPTPEFAASVADELERLVLRFDDPTLRTVAQRKLENCTNAEIAAELGVTSRTVIRKLNLIRQEWEEAESTDR